MASETKREAENDVLILSFLSFLFFLFFLLPIHHPLIIVCLIVFLKLPIGNFLLNFLSSFLPYYACECCVSVGGSGWIDRYGW